MMIIGLCRQNWPLQANMLLKITNPSTILIKTHAKINLKENCKCIPDAHPLIKHTSEKKSIDFQPSTPLFFHFSNFSISGKEFTHTPRKYHNYTSPNKVQ